MQGEGSLPPGRRCRQDNLDATRLQPERPDVNMQISQQTRFQLVSPEYVPI